METFLIFAIIILIIITITTNIAKANHDVSRHLTRDKQVAVLVTKNFAVSHSVIKRLVIQKASTQVRAAWRKDTQKLNTDKELKNKIAMMKLSEVDAESCLGNIKKFKAFDQNNTAMVTKDNVLKGRIVFKYLVIHND